MTLLTLPHLHLSIKHTKGIKGYYTKMTRISINLAHAHNYVSMSMSWSRDPRSTSLSVNFWYSWYLDIATQQQPLLQCAIYQHKGNYFPNLLGSKIRWQKVRLFLLWEANYTLTKVLEVQWIFLKKYWRKVMVVKCFFLNLFARYRSLGSKRLSHITVLSAWLDFLKLYYVPCRKFWISQRLSLRPGWSLSS